MKNEGMTELQRQARQEGLSISAYARAHGIPAQRIFDAVARLRRRGALPDHSVKRGKFIAVKIAPPPINNAPVCRMLVSVWPRPIEARRRAC
jgi:transposase-like protein